MGCLKGSPDDAGDSWGQLECVASLDCAGWATDLVVDWATDLVVGWATDLGSDYSSLDCSANLTCSEICGKK